MTNKLLANCTARYPRNSQLEALRVLHMSRIAATHSSLYWPLIRASWPKRTWIGNSRGALKFRLNSSHHILGVTHGVSQFSLGGRTVKGSCQEVSHTDKFFASFTVPEFVWPNKNCPPCGHFRGWEWNTNERTHWIGIMQIRRVAVAVENMVMNAKSRWWICTVAPVNSWMANLVSEWVKSGPLSPIVQLYKRIFKCISTAATAAAHFP